MDKKPSEKLSSENDKQPTFSCSREKIKDLIKSNWLAIICAVGIAIITIIVVPIIYTRPQSKTQITTVNLSWDIDGKTIVNQSSLLNGLSKNSLGLISSIVIDQQNNYLYIVDKTKHRILKFYLNNNQNLILLFGHQDGSSGNNSTSLNSPNDLLIDSQSNNIYVADTLNHRIQLFTTDSTSGVTICGTGISGSNLNQLNQPMSLTMDQSSNIYIADYGNNRIISFNLLTNETNILIDYNQNGERNTYLITPISIQYSSTPSSLVIAQETGFNVVRWNLNPNTTYWTLIAGSASSQLNGTSRTLFNKLTFIYADCFNHTYVVDTYNQRIQFYAGDMQKGKTVAGVIQAPGNNSYIFNQPTAIAFDKDFNLYVADSNNFRIQKFSQIGVARSC